MLQSRSLFHHQVASTIYKNFTRLLSKDYGISRRKKVIPIDSSEINEFDFDEMETDFMEVHKSHKQHMREMKLMKEKEKYLIVKQKYFKEKFPNFLTWHDKEQIKYLYRTQPDEWTIERLSEGFPALPETIKKIVKANWTKIKPQKILNHDNSVQKNWELFKKGKMADLPPELTEHLNKFTNRALKFQPFEIPVNSSKIEIKRVKPVGEFSEIIDSYQKLKKKHQVDENKIGNSENQIMIECAASSEPIDLSENYTYYQSKDKESVTLKELQHKIHQKIEQGATINSEEKLMIMKSIHNNDNPINIPSIDNTDIDELSKNKYQTSSGSIGNYIKKSKSDLSHLQYPEKIVIPKNILKRGKTYKLNDCYYDDDGEFLYRVPGMN